MISVIKEICIFMIVAQAILFFVPGNSYGKYVRLLVGVMLILRIIEPLFGLMINEERQLEIKERIWELEQAVHAESRELVLEDSRAVVSREIAEELKGRLEACSGAYRIENVAWDGEKESVVITVSEKKEPEEKGQIWIEPVEIGIGEREGEPEKEKLQELYAGALGVETGKIEINWK